MNTQNIKVLIEEQKLQDAVKEMADKINQDFEGTEIVAIGLLKGCFVFMADLLRNLKLDLRVHFMEVSSYGEATKSSGVVQIIKDLGESIEGKNVLIVEDIVDSGLTLNYIKGILMDRNPKTLKICAMLNKPEARKTDIAVDYIGFNIPNEFVVGYGLDCAEKYRNLPYVGVLECE